MVNRMVLMTILIFGAAASGLWSWLWGTETSSFRESGEAFVNPLMGYAPPADSGGDGSVSSLVYIDVTWRELEPEEGIYAWDAIEKENQVERWRGEGRHAVFRFVCDRPSGEAHMDIPEWLYEKTGGDGTSYDMDYGKGYSPNYNNEVFIAAHERAILALGERYGEDTFVSYVQLGSLGHWGEWHVKYDAGIQRIPMTEVRERYVTPYVKAFPKARILMRRPLAEALRYGFGVYNDMAGHPGSTKEWLDWIEDGGVYNQTGEACMVAMEDVWKRAPVGGEFTSSIPMERMLGSDLALTVELIRESHTTFLGPKAPDVTDPGALEALKNMGYRVWISRIKIKKGLSTSKVSLTWNNSGTAPFYWDWPVYLYGLDKEGNVVEKTPVDLKLTALMPGESLQTETELSWYHETGSIAALGAGIEDPMTGRPCVRLTMEVQHENGIALLFQ